MIVKIKVELASEKKRCGIYDGKIKEGEKYYLTRWDWEPHTTRRVTCALCAE